MINLATHSGLINCSEIVIDSLFFIKDTSTTSVLCTEVDAQLNVINNDGINVVFLKIDGCVYTDRVNKRCDCALITSDKLYFVEFKEQQDFSKSKTRIMRKARGQLITTLNNFKTYGIDLTQTFAIIALTPMLPHSHRQIVGAGKQTEIADFLNQTGCPNLFYGNILEL